MSTFEIGEADFLLDGRPHRILAGALHYFRVHPEHWADRIRKARLMGLNTIETYVAWNAHEPVRGEWDATGANDLGRFLDLVAEEGMHAIVRPGPYICAEWHNGGLPTWLTALPGIGLRRSESTYLAEVSRYLERVYEIVAPRQIDRGGNVILVQIENEYGAYGDDTAYLEHLVRLTRSAGITVPLTTVDQPQPQMLRDGSVTGAHLSGSFGSRAAERLATLREHQPTGPLVCSEFWDGWFDSWTGPHHTTSAADAAAELDALLAAGASVNVYMFHGGTNFGLTNGANHKGRYVPILTSYDYDAPLDEAGRPTEKYRAFREVIARYAPVPDEQPPAPQPAPALEVPLAAVDTDPFGRAESLPAQDAPATFDELEHLGGLLRYDVELPGPHEAARVLAFDDVRDAAWVEVDGRPVGRMLRALQERSIALPPGRHLRIVVEEQGRVNYDERLGEPKGLIGTPLLDGHPLTGWTASPVDVAELARRGESLAAEAAPGRPVVGPAVLAGAFDLERPTDLFLDTDGWGRGVVTVNGFLLGRYWRNGPQRTLYVPGPVLRAGRNTIAVVELEAASRASARFVPQPLLGHLEE
ncbi:glycoside hydrolase family 35 protein [Arenivirga flava]|uniref:Beta-galactosidase n=1 Tax=Arenivirga flava TaxID=1930060 RepID=A0AA37XD43_9MICO|nr:beta-galactosidase family protein [Arenivirga flava]GMA29147.1 beta-galactosidase [Arenivirga flava]